MPVPSIFRKSSKSESSTTTKRSSFFSSGKGDADDSAGAADAALFETLDVPAGFHLPFVNIPEDELVDTDILLDHLLLQDDIQKDQLQHQQPLGNQELLKLLDSEECDYFLLKSLQDKIDKECELVDKLRIGGARFLTREKASKGGDKKQWRDIGNKEMGLRISIMLRNRQPASERTQLSSRTIEFAIVQGNICNFDADIVALKHAQKFLGVDKIVAEALEKTGTPRSEFSCQPYGYRFKNTAGAIRARDILYVGTPHYYLWDLYQVQEFSRRALDILHTEAPTTRHLAITLHGPGLKLSEPKSIMAEVRGLLIAMNLGTIPMDLHRITLVEMDAQRVASLQQTLDQVFRQVDFAKRSGTADWVYNFDIPAIPPTHDPLREVHLRQDSIASMSIPPSHWCISYDQLIDIDLSIKMFYGPENYSTKTMRNICEDIIKPVCTRSPSYALYLNPNGLPIGAFVSHCWDGHFSDFVQSIRNAFQTSVEKPNLWICAFALFQAQGLMTDSSSLTAQQIGSGDQPLEASPFVQAMKEASMFCVVRNSRKDIFTRIWCVCELMYAKKGGLFPGKTYVTGPNTFATDANTTVHDAEATNLEDKDRIMRVLLNHFDRAEIDSLIQQLRIQDTPQEMDVSS